MLEENSNKPNNSLRKTKTLNNKGNKLKARLKTKLFFRFQLNIEPRPLMSLGKLFQRYGTVEEKALAPCVENLGPSLQDSD